jgi:hypothetical protein
MCLGDHSGHPYGTDPTLLATSSLYDPDVDELSSITKAYDCEQELPFGEPLDSRSSACRDAHFFERGK